MGLLAAVTALASIAPTLLTGGEAPAWMTFILGVFKLPFLILACGALLRLSLSLPPRDHGNERLGDAGVQWTNLETRLLWAYLLRGVYCVLLLAALLVVWLILFVTVATIFHTKTPTISPRPTPPEIMALLTSPFGLELLVTVIPMALVLAYLWFKLSFTLIGTAVQGRVMVWSSWRSTNGLFWSIAAIWLICFLVEFGFGFVGGFSGTTLRRALEPPTASLLAQRTPIAICTGLSTLVYLPFLIGGWSSLYRTKTGFGGTAQDELDRVFA